MDISQTSIDILRAVHLICFAAGMGTALYCDFSSLRAFNAPIQKSDIVFIERVHKWIAAALAGLWISGIALIYVRTGFDLEAFSPKLWLKVALMVLVVGVAALMGRIVLPLLKANLGQPLTSVSPGKLASSAQIGITSLFCWTSGLALGSSVVLKTAPWEVLLPLTLGWFVILTVAGQIAITLVRIRDGQTSNQTSSN